MNSTTGRERARTLAGKTVFDRAPPDHEARLRPMVDAGNDLADAEHLASCAADRPGHRTPGTGDRNPSAERTMGGETCHCHAKSPVADKK